MIIYKKTLTGILITFAIISFPTLTHAATASPVTPITTKTTGEIKFKENSNNTPILDPTNPDPLNPVTPPNSNGTTGPLAINYISKFKFKEEFISGTDQIYYAELDSIKLADKTDSSVPNFIQITDNRGTNVGWKLQVQQGNQFIAGTNELVGASLKLSHPTIKTVQGNLALPPTAPPVVTIVPGSNGVLGPAQDVLTADVNKGMATWIETFGDAATGDKSVSLSVPGTTAKVKDTSYSTELTWTLLDSPV